MGRHTFSCPVCSVRQTVEVPNGQPVTGTPCAACTEALAQLQDNPKLQPEEVTRATAATLDQLKAYRKANAA